MIDVKVVDEAGVLQPAELTRLKKFIINHCVSSSETLAMLEQVKIQNDGAAGYSGYWSAKYNRVGADVKDVIAVIVLNCFYLKTVEQLEATLAHEFGHHWTIGNLMNKFEMIGWFDERAPWLYYRIRGLDPTKYARDYSLGWGQCDKEVLAEDYKHRCSPYTGAHRMELQINNPTTEVRDYIENLGKPYWL